MTGTVLALECPSSLRKFIPFCEARRHENAARVQCWKGAALEIHRKCESSRAPRTNLTPRRARSRSERITQETASFGRSPERFAHVWFLRSGPEDLENDVFATRPRRFAHFRVGRTGPENCFCTEVQWNLATFGSAGKLFGSSYDRTRKFFSRKSYAVCHFRVRTPFGV